MDNTPTHPHKHSDSSGSMDKFARARSFHQSGQDPPFEWVLAGGGEGEVLFSVFIKLKNLRLLSVPFSFVRSCPFCYRVGAKKKSLRIPSFPFSPPSFASSLSPPILRLREQGCMPKCHRKLPTRKPEGSEGWCLYMHPIFIFLANKQRTNNLLHVDRSFLMLCV